MGFVVLETNPSFIKRVSLSKSSSIFCINLWKIFGAAFDFSNNPLSLLIATFNSKVLKTSLISVNNIHNRIFLEFEMNLDLILEKSLCQSFYRDEKYKVDG